MEADNYDTSRDSHDRIHAIHGPSTATCHGLQEEVGVCPTSATSLDPGGYLPFGAVAFRWWYWSCTMAPTGLSSQQPPPLPIIIIRPLLVLIPVGKQQQAALIQSSRSDDGMAAHATSEPEMAVDVTTICRATYCLWTLGMILLTNRYMVQGGYDQNRRSSGIWSSFVDFHGHWLLILLGIALFAMMGAV
jgi:hypothetical protein